MLGQPVKPAAVRLETDRLKGVCAALWQLLRFSPAGPQGPARDCGSLIEMRLSILLGVRSSVGWWLAHPDLA